MHIHGALAEQDGSSYILVTARQKCYHKEVNQKVPPNSLEIRLKSDKKHTLSFSREYCSGRAIMFMYCYD